MESKSAKKNKKRHNKKKPEFQGGAKEKSDTSPEYLLEALKEKLIEAKASQVWCTTLFFILYNNIITEPDHFYCKLIFLNILTYLYSINYTYSILTAQMCFNEQQFLNVI